MTTLLTYLDHLDAGALVGLLVLLFGAMYLLAAAIGKYAEPHMMEDDEQ